MEVIIPMIYSVEHTEKAARIIDASKCEDDCTCCGLEHRGLCEAKMKEGFVSYLECLDADPKNCTRSWFLGEWNSYVCSCPSRIYIAKALHRWEFSCRNRFLMPYWSATEFVVGRDDFFSDRPTVWAYVIMLYSGEITHQKKTERAFILPVRTIE